MAEGRDEIRWSPRLAPAKLRRLYESEAAGRLDDDLLADVGLTLLMRCQDIIAVHEANLGRVLCHRCARNGERRVIARKTHSLDETVRCDTCGWSITWHDYRRSFARRQLNLGGAGPAFNAFVEQYPRAATPAERMLLIDRLIHEFHYSLRDQPDRPTRAACVNLIDGKLHEVVRFLNDLTAGVNASPALRRTHEAWRANLSAAGEWHPK